MYKEYVRFRKAAGKSYSQKNLNKLTTGGSKPGTYITKGSGSAGSSSGGKSIVCTAMYQTTAFDNDWANGNESLVHISKKTFIRCSP